MIRLFDLFFSFLGLIILSPILLLLWIIGLLENGSPFFTQKRVGYNEKIFLVIKFRTMKKNTKSVATHLVNQSMITKYGNFLRRTKLDELPQLFNVLKGEMSIVGPRPHMVEHDIHYSSLFKNFLKRHKCNPGLTGWAQVNGLRGATPKPEIMEKRMDYDLWYLNNWSIWLDIYIIFKTYNKYMPLIFL